MYPPPRVLLHSLCCLCCHSTRTQLCPPWWAQWFWQTRTDHQQSSVNTSGTFFFSTQNWVFLWVKHSVFSFFEVFGRSITVFSSFWMYYWGPFSFWHSARVLGPFCTVFASFLMDYWGLSYFWHSAWVFGSSITVFSLSDG